MLDRLQQRFEARKVRAQQTQQHEADRLARLERLHEQANVMRVLLEDARYHDYRQLLEEAREHVVTAMKQLDREEPQAFALQQAFLQGRLFQLDAILSTPDTFLALADEGDSAPGVSR